MIDAPIFRVRLRRDDLFWLRDMLLGIVESAGAQGAEHKKARRTLRRILSQLEHAEDITDAQREPEAGEEGSSRTGTHGPIH